MTTTKQPQPGKCQWPTSDEVLTPNSPTEFICPNTTKRGQPYCEHHTAKATGQSGPRTGAPGVVRK